MATIVIISVKWSLKMCAKFVAIFTNSKFIKEKSESLKLWFLRGDFFLALLTKKALLLQLFFGVFFH
jgi:hypothetical protein